MKGVKKGNSLTDLRAMGLVEHLGPTWCTAYHMCQQWTHGCGPFEGVYVITVPV
jgi:hypothetical protein